MAISAPSEALGPNLKILVQPPCLSLYFGPKSLKALLAAFWDKRLIKDLLELKFCFLAIVITFSIKGANSLALALVVVIFPFRIKFEAKILINARL